MIERGWSVRRMYVCYCGVWSIHGWSSRAIPDVGNMIENIDHWRLCSMSNCKTINSNIVCTSIILSRFPTNPQIMKPIFPLVISVIIMISSFHARMICTLKNKLIERKHSRAALSDVKSNIYYIRKTKKCFQVKHNEDARQFSSTHAYVRLS